MNDGSRRYITIVICILFFSISSIILGILTCFGVLSTPEEEQESNVLEFWEREPIAYGGLFPPSNHSLNGEVLPQSSVIDVIIVGAGMAGLSAALKLCERRKRVLILEANVRTVFYDFVGSMITMNNPFCRIRLEEEYSVLISRVHRLNLGPSSCLEVKTIPSVLSAI